MNICIDCAKQESCSNVGVGCIGYEKINICKSCVKHPDNGGKCEKTLGAINCIDHEVRE